MKFHVRQNKKNKLWYWRLVTRNGRIIADSGQGYHSKQMCMYGLHLVRGGKRIPVIFD